MTDVTFVLFAVHAVHLLLEIDAHRCGLAVRSGRSGGNVIRRKVLVAAGNFIHRAGVFGQSVFRNRLKCTQQTADNTAAAIQTFEFHFIICVDFARSARCFLVEINNLLFGLRDFVFFFCCGFCWCFRRRLGCRGFSRFRCRSCRIVRSRRFLCCGSCILRERFDF